MKSYPFPPVLPAPVEEPPSGEQWIHEIKYDGYRTSFTASREVSAPLVMSIGGLPSDGSHTGRGAPMVGYRVYFLDGVNRFTHAEWVKAENDEEAVQRAKRFGATAVKCEIWQGSRLVKRLTLDWPDL